MVVVGEIRGGVGQGQPAIRLGLKSIKGFTEKGGLRIEGARRTRPFSDIDDVKQRALLDAKDMQALAEADAFRSVAGHRRKALWASLGTERPTALLRGTKRPERQPKLRAMDEGQEVLADYDRVGLTVRSHPLALLRPKLKKMRLHSSEDLRFARPGQIVRPSGIVINRQRPDTDSGVIFATMDDEFGFVNVTVWARVAEQFRAALTHSQLMTVHGTVDRDATTVYVVADRIVDHSALLGGLRTSSRDFH